jgi:hypothetical protein
MEYDAVVAAASAADLHSNLPPPPPPDEPLVLLTDTRDVVFQADLFAEARGQIEALGPSAASLPVLFVAAEPEGSTVGGEAWNTLTARSCFRPSIVDAMADLPILCSGTTLGTLSAVEAYLDTIVQSLPFCLGAGQPLRFGVDQPLHILVAHTAMLAAAVRAAGLEPSSWADAHGGGRVAASASPALPLPSGAVAAYARLYRSMTSLPASFATEEPAYRALNEGAAELGRRVVVLPLFSEDGPICTLALTSSPVLVPAPTGIPGGKFVGTGAAGAPDGDGAPPQRPCALVHQYDRHGHLIKLFDVAFLGVDPTTPYCEKDRPGVCY